MQCRVLDTWAQTPVGGHEYFINLETLSRQNDFIILYCPDFDFLCKFH